MPVSSSEFLIIVFATAAKTSRMFDVSVACVMLQWIIRFSNSMRRPGHSLWIHAELCSIRLHEPPQDILGRLIYIRPTRVLLKVLLQWHLENSWFTEHEHEMEQIILTLRSFRRKTSILFKNRTMDVLRNHRELITESKRTRDSAIRF